LFVSTLENDQLNLYYSDRLMGPWRQHPESPVIRNNKNISRPAGRLLVIDDKLYRFAQDDDPTYGNQVFAFEITKISVTSYEERMVSDSPIIKASGKGWNAHAMHQIDALCAGINECIAAVDGR